MRINNRSHCGEKREYWALKIEPSPIKFPPSSYHQSPTTEFPIIEKVGQENPAIKKPKLVNFGINSIKFP